ncbi:hypothetical protein RJT34_09515 [Clitoria ternatea]|uniref:BHLH domain-containing protein n=1 Tax=Clitoria ternatea TaxID=43366 RepID=A0AAN9K508_CLITE
MDGVENVNAMGLLQHGNNVLATSVSEMTVSSVSVAMPSSGVANHFVASSAWDPLVPLSQVQIFGGSPMVSYIEYANSSYPLQGISTDAPLVQYISDSNLVDMVQKIPSYGSGSFSEMVGSFGQHESSDIANTGYYYQPHYDLSDEAGIERSQINNEQYQGEGSTPEEEETGSGLHENRSKGGLDYDSAFSPNKKSEGNATKDSYEKDPYGVKEKYERKPKVDENSCANSSGKQSLKQKKDDSDSGEALTENFIHVRARRGQATNSHSLAERVRREKISERMKLLQELVPGCNKITGKALMLDEIINYVQSLQQQVEIGQGPLSGYDPSISCTHPFPSGSFQGTLAGTSTPFPSLPQSVVNQSFYGMSYNSRTPLENLGHNGNTNPFDCTN